jgi:hypothetical protein
MLFLHCIKHLLKAYNSKLGSGKELMIFTTKLRFFIELTLVLAIIFSLIKKNQGYKFRVSNQSLFLRSQ